MNRNIRAGALMVNDPFTELIYLERYYMKNLDEKSRKELYEAFSKRIQEAEIEMNALRKQVRERDLRIQLYQFSADKLEELKDNLDAYPNLDELWTEFELAYKIATGKNLVRLEELEEKRESYQKQVNNL